MQCHDSPTVTILSHYSKNCLPIIVILTLKLMPIPKTLHKIPWNLFHLLPYVIFLSIAKYLSKIPCLDILNLGTYQETFG